MNKVIDQLFLRILNQKYLVSWVYDVYPSLFLAVGIVYNHFTLSRDSNNFILLFQFSKLSEAPRVWNSQNAFLEQVLRSSC